VVGQSPASVFDTGTAAMPFVPSSALIPPNRQEAFGSGEEALSRMIPQPPSEGSISSILMDRIRTLNKQDRRNSQAPFSDAGPPDAPAAPLDGAHFSDFFRDYGAATDIDPEDATRQAPPWPDDDEEQANLRALEARLSSTGNIRDAVELYKARTAGRR